MRGVAQTCATSRDRRRDLDVGAIFDVEVGLAQQPKGRFGWGVGIRPPDPATPPPVVPGGEGRGHLQVGAVELEQGLGLVPEAANPLG
jgi:hypothetical protein